MRSGRLMSDESRYSPVLPTEKHAEGVRAMSQHRPSRAAVEHRIRAACDTLIGAGLLAVGWPLFDDDNSGVIDLCVETVEGISLDEAGRLLSNVIGYTVAPCRQAVDYVAAYGSVVPPENWIYRASRSA